MNDSKEWPKKVLECLKCYGVLPGVGQGWPCVCVCVCVCVYYFG